MKKLLIIISIYLLTVMSYGQVGVGTTDPHAQLDIRSSNQAAPISTDGILIPKVDVFPTGVTANQDAMMVYLTITVGTDAPGFYYYSHVTTSWLSIGGSGAEKIDDLLDGKSDNDGSDDGSSVFLGIGAGVNDNSTDNRSVGIGYQSLNSNITGYYNVANGYQSLNANTTGYGNVANGYMALARNISGRGNVANGYVALLRNTSGEYNTATGSQSLSFNDTGDHNVANGYNSLTFNNTGNNNVGVGSGTLYGNSSGNNNIGIGFESLYWSASGSNNIAIGSEAMYLNGTGSNNIAIGSEAMYLNGTGTNNIATGFQSLYSNETGAYNIAFGDLSLYSNETGNYNVASGFAALNSNTIGSYNIASGYQSLYSNETGTNNIATGYQSLYRNTTGNYNVAIGDNALRNNVSGGNNVVLGRSAGYNELGSNKLYIENSDSSTPLIYGEFDNDLLRINGTLEINNAYQFPTTDGAINQVMQTDGAGNLTWQERSLPWIDSGTDVSYDNVSVDNNLISINNQRINGTATSLRFGSISGTYIGVFTNSTELGVVNNGVATLGSNAFRWDEIWSVNALNTTSDKRLKKEINTINYGLESLLKLKPVSYKWKTGKQDTKLGFLAQDVEQVIPEVVSHKTISQEEKKQYHLEGRTLPSDDLYAMTYSELIPVLVKAIQEQNQEIKVLKTELEKKNITIEKRLKALENKSSN
ncbi:MAG: hypothetical protein ACI8QQ_001045 [Psychroserpens sp.]|jgi:hypothetical protein